MFRSNLANQHFWNFIASIAFAGILIFFVITLGVGKDIMPKEVPLFDFFLLALATFRLIRLFSYDKITQFARDFCFDISISGEGTANEIVTRVKPSRGPRRTIIELLECPWCTGVWLALFVTFLYFYTPFAWYPILMLAVAGLASFFQLTANAIGWSAELKKIKVGNAERQ